MKKVTKMLVLLVAVLFVINKANAQLSVGISVGFAPPALPVYVQPACPYDGYMWVPGYWAYDNVDGYYWVPGVWVAAPRPGFLWTPAYWGYAGGAYGFHAGYWGPHVGFYGGINYGFGYGGVGFGGGVWAGGSFRYNTAVMNVNTTVVHNTYVDRTVVNNVTVNNHTSFNGPGGVAAQPRPEEMAAMKEQHLQPTAEQQSHQQTAHSDPTQFAKNNNGRPTATAMTKVGGTPVNEHGGVAANSKLGNQNANALKANQVKNPGLTQQKNPAMNQYRANRQQQRQQQRQQKQQQRQQRQNKPQPKEQ